MLGAAALAFDEGMADQSGACRSVRMAHGDGAAIDVQAFIGNTQLVAAVKHLHGKGFVEFPQIDIVNLHARALQQPRDGKDRTNTHFIRLATGHRESAEYAQRREAALFGEFRVHDHGGG